MQEAHSRDDAVRRPVRKLPPGRTWRELPREVEREMKAWMERRRHGSAQRATATEDRPTDLHAAHS